MNENKNIERLFQEKFKDFEVVPNESNWDNIEARLNEKEKRRIIPFWWRLSGVAAALLLGFLITNALFFSNPIGKNNVVNQENNIPSKTQPNGKSNENSIKTIKENEAVVASEAKILKNKSSQNKTKEGSLKSPKNNSLNNNNDIVYSNEKVKNENNVDNNINQKNKINRKKSSANFNINPSVLTKNDNKSPIDLLQKKEIVVTKNNQLVSSDLEKKEAVINKNNLVVNNALEKAITNQEKPVSKDITSPKSTFENKSFESLNPNKEILAENTIIEIKNIDTTKIAVVTNALEELLKEKEVKKKAEPKLNRWQVATNVAPIYFSSTSGGSPLDSRFESNDKEFQPSFSYGLGVNYSLNKKWSIRTGVNALALEYKTNNVVFFQTVNARQIEHVKSNLQGSLIQIENKDNSEPIEIGANSEIIEKFNGSINQKMGYIEIPVEFSYKLMDKKFGIDLISGFSSLFLNENSVSVLSSNGGEFINIGRANNLNDIHFSGNLGFGFRYRFWKAFNANVNPMLKYQMNTFNSDSGNFKPYAFGLYSGISYTF